MRVLSVELVFPNFLNCRSCPLIIQLRTVCSTVVVPLLYYSVGGKTPPTTKSANESLQKESTQEIRNGSRNVTLGQ